jgi:hypothetical protein
MSAKLFRQVALSLPRAIEASHMGKPDFRVDKRIFATLWPDGIWGMVKLTSEQQQVVVAAEPTLFRAVPGGWGLSGATNICLDGADERTLRSALTMAWTNTAQKTKPARPSAKAKPAPVRASRPRAKVGKTAK